MCGQLSAGDRHPGRRVTWYEGVADWQGLVDNEIYQPAQRSMNPPTTSTKDVEVLPTSSSAFVSGQQRVVILGEYSDPRTTW